MDEKKRQPITQDAEKVAGGLPLRTQTEGNDQEQTLGGLNQEDNLATRNVPNGMVP